MKEKLCTLFGRCTGRIPSLESEFKTLARAVLKNQSKSSKDLQNAFVDRQNGILTNGISTEKASVDSLCAIYGSEKVSEIFFDLADAYKFRFWERPIITLAKALENDSQDSIKPLKPVVI